MPDAHAAFYFSSVTYTTTGYGDLVLPEQWRLIGGIEALTGILMCGWSTGFFFAIVSSIMVAAAVGNLPETGLPQTSPMKSSYAASPLRAPLCGDIAIAAGWLNR